MRLRRDDGTDLTFDSVEWTDGSFKSPIFYGLRGAYFFPGSKRWGVALDFTHAKIISDTSQVTRVHGTRGGTATDESRTIRPDIESMELSDGHNFLTLNAIHRWFPSGARDRGFWGRLQPYVGAGAGVAIPHVEVNSGDVFTSEYQAVGPAVQAFAGANFDIHGPWSAFIEYKLTWSDVTLDLDDGATIETRPWVNQFIVGLSFRW